MSDLATRADRKMHVYTLSTTPERASLRKSPRLPVYFGDRVRRRKLKCVAAHLVEKLAGALGTYASLMSRHVYFVTFPDSPLPRKDCASSGDAAPCCGH